MSPLRANANSARVTSQTCIANIDIVVARGNTNACGIAYGDIEAATGVEKSVRPRRFLAASGSV